MPWKKLYWKSSSSENATLFGDKGGDNTLAPVLSLLVTAWCFRGLVGEVGEITKLSLR